AILKVALLVVISSLLRGCHCVTLARLSWPRSRPKPGKLKYISDNTSTQHRWLSGGSPSRDKKIPYEPGGPELLMDREACRDPVSPLEKTLCRGQLFVPSWLLLRLDPPPAKGESATRPGGLEFRKGFICIAAHETIRLRREG